MVASLSYQFFFSALPRPHTVLAMATRQFEQVDVGNGLAWVIKQ